MSIELSPQMQNQLAQLEQVRQQMQLITNQRLQLEGELSEVEKALEELKKVSEDTPVYKTIGSILVKAENPEAVVKELSEQKETLSIRVKTLERQEKRLKERYESLGQQLSQAIRGLQDLSAAGGGGV
jgi:prefoldin beta subunit